MTIIRGRAEIGSERVAHPCEAVRILVVETEGSV